MKKRYLHRIMILFVSLTMIFPMIKVNATTLEDEDFGYYEYALTLQKLGVFLGDGQGFRLADTSNRLEALVILIRLLGKEEEAKLMINEESVYSDVPLWGVPYVNYAARNGLTNGIGQGQFGSDQELSPEMFVTFLLRALGYSDVSGTTVDFFWEDSLSFANDLGLISEETLVEIRSGHFIRNLIAKLSYDTLVFGMKEGDTSLVAYLVEEGSIVKTIAIENGLLEAETIEQGTSTPGEDTTPSKIDNVNNEEKEPVYLVGPPSATKEQLEKWARSKGMSEEGISLIPIYFELSMQKGLDPILQYVQMCIETGYLYKNRSETTVLDASYYNPCGLKTPAGGDDYDPEAHTRFASWYDGIDAHTDHSALYAGVEGYPLADTKDPRHFKYLFASGPTVELMARKWVGDDSEEGIRGTNYENLILKLYDQVLVTQ